MSKLDTLRQKRDKLVNEASKLSSQIEAEEAKLSGCSFGDHVHVEFRYDRLNKTVVLRCIREDFKTLVRDEAKEQLDKIYSKMENIIILPF